MFKNRQRFNYHMIVFIVYINEKQACDKDTRTILAQDNIGSINKEIEEIKFVQYIPHEFSLSLSHTHTHTQNTIKMVNCKSIQVSK